MLPGNVGSGQADGYEFPVAQAIQFFQPGMVTTLCPQCPDRRPDEFREDHYALLVSQCRTT